MNYFYEDFTEKNYMRLLEIMSREGGGRKFRAFDRFEEDGVGVLLRHDIDFSVHRAYRIAKMENERGIGSTFFVFLHSEFYNVLEKDIINLLKDISKLGHQIGLHFCGNEFYGLQCKETEQLEVFLKNEQELLEKICECKVNAFSFHNPTHEELKKYQSTYYASMVNTYAASIKERYEYCSDSNGYWRFQRLEEFLMEREGNIQVLLHPVWWTPEVLSPFDRIKRAAEGRKQKQLKNYVESLDAAGRKNIKKMV